MSNELSGKTVAFLVAAEGIEQVELTEPWKAVQQAGGTPQLVSSADGDGPGDEPHGQGRHVRGRRRRSTRREVALYDALVLPGGVANPDQLRTQPKAVAFARSFFDAGKPVAVICHGPWTLVEADVVRGRHAHQLAEPADRHPQRRRRRGSTRRSRLTPPGRTR